MLDLDNFKTVNDSFGDAFGDEILLNISARIRGKLREEDTLARLGGDELAFCSPTWIALTKPYRSLKRFC